MCPYLNKVKSPTALLAIWILKACTLNKRRFDENKIHMDVRQEIFSSLCAVNSGKSTHFIHSTFFNFRFVCKNKTTVYIIAFAFLIPTCSTQFLCISLFFCGCLNLDMCCAFDFSYQEVSLLEYFRSAALSYRSKSTFILHLFFHA